jgi:type II secretory pathway pseudopilin PulG
MSQDLQAKFLAYLLQEKSRKAEAGFTLIELLVVGIMIGILTAISLPAFLNQAQKARQAEAKQVIGSLNRANQAFYLENQHFSSDFSSFGVAIQTQTSNYQYFITNANQSNPPDPNDISYTQATVGWADPIRSDSLQPYIGIVDVVQSGGALVTVTIVCEGTVNATLDTSAFAIDSSSSSTSPTCSGSFQPVQ